MNNTASNDGTAVDFRMPVGFSQSLLPTINFVPKIVAPWNAQMRELIMSLRPDLSVDARYVSESLNRRVLGQSGVSQADVSKVVRQLHTTFGGQKHDQLASIMANMPSFSVNKPSFSVPTFDLSAIYGLAPSSGLDALIKRISEQHARMLEDLRRTLGSLLHTDALHGINRNFLPPNLQEYADELNAYDVYKFVEQEGIPLCLVPRGRIALRLLRAKDRAARRKVLGDCYNSLMEDCASILESVDQSVVGSEVTFALDGLGAMRAGYPRSAQAMLTATLDTLIARFYPDRKVRRSITNRKKGADVPDVIDEMSVRRALVWLPIWNAHEEFWKDKGDKVPHYYSRHASVHSVSSRQFNKRNCVQVLMLVTSLIGYAEQLISASRNSAA